MVRVARVLVVFTLVKDFFVSIDSFPVQMYYFICFQFALHPYLDNRVISLILDLG
jgi:hypothetical protein